MSIHTQTAVPDESVGARLPEPHQLWHGTVLAELSAF
jgi:hypothetical protein